VPDAGGRSGHCDPANGQQLFNVKLQAHAEHQQDHADLRELLGVSRFGTSAFDSIIIVRPD